MVTKQSSGNVSFSTSSYSSSSYSSSSSSSARGQDGQSYTKSHTEQSTWNNRDGGRIESTTRETGQPTRFESTDLSPAGHQLRSSTSQQQGRIEDVTDKDQEYLDKMEDEYAKREGGA